MGKAKSRIILGAICLSGIFSTQAQTFTKIISGDIVNDGMKSKGVSWGDYDNDGYLDLFVSNGGQFGNQNNFLYRNNGDSTFTKITIGSIVNDGGKSYACTWGDYDNDCYLDLFVANFGQNNYLYHNNGDGTFAKITAGTIVNDGMQSIGATWGDYDNDGNLDLFVANLGNNLLYHNNGDGTFTKITTGNIVNDGGSSSGGFWGDYDDDGFLDLFVSNRWDENNFLYHNNGDSTFTKIISGPIVTDGGYSSGGSWSDYDNDGALDLLVPNDGGFKNFLYKNNGDGTFTNITTGSIVNDMYDGYGSSWADYDNDGDLDMFVAHDDGSNYMYANNGDSTFTKIIGENIVSDGGQSIACSWGDYNGDGFLDLFVGNGGTSDQNNFLYLNNGNSNNWINIKLIGTISNRSAIGTKVRIKAIINSNPIWQLQEISGQSGRTSQNSLDVEFGLGDAIIIDSLIIDWPSGIQRVDTNVAVNQFIMIEEDSIDPDFGYTINGLKVNFFDSTFWNGLYHWDFGDGDTSILINPIHTFPDTGTYTVCLRVFNYCGVNDTICKIIFIPCDTTQANFGYTIDTLLQVSFTDSSINADSLWWDFGDGDTSTQINPTHIFPDTGTYTVCLVISNYCDYDTICKTIFIPCDTTHADFNYSIDDLKVTFTDSSINADSFWWDFGDGDTSTLINPIHIFPDTGTYTVCLIVSNYCDKDTICKTIIILCDAPKADFSYIIDGLKVFLKDSSINAELYWWDFGDGNFSTLPDPTHTYVDTGTYTICLVVSNLCGNDTICKNITISNQRSSCTLFLPNAFTPNDDGKNEILRPEVKGVSKISWTIYDRFGAKVFETNDINEKWDGTYKGKQVNMGVYVYYIKIECLNNDIIIQKGNITLLR